MRNMQERMIENSRITPEASPNIEKADMINNPAERLSGTEHFESESNELPEKMQDSKENKFDVNKLPEKMQDPKENNSEANELPKKMMDSKENDSKEHELPKRIETSEGREAESEDKATYNDLTTMKKELGKNYGDIKADKPNNSPNLAKWFDNGGSIQIEDADGKKVWTYIDSNGREVKYVDGYPVFPPEAKHPILGDISIGEFTGDRYEDKKLYLKALEEQYGITEIPDGYVLHHDSENGTMQLVQEDWHKEFTHAGGYSLYKED